jgi:methyl-accepting chemotaxis protein
MTQDDYQLFVSLAQFSLDTSAMQIMSIKMFLAMFEGADRMGDLRDQFARTKDSEQVHELRAQFDAVKKKLSDGNSTLKSALQDVLARAESQHEQIEHVLVKARASLQPPPEQA